MLARVIGLFAGRGYNIDSLTVTEVEHEKHLSRITVITSGTPAVMQQIKHQLERLVPVHRVRDLTEEGGSIERELALVKVGGKGDKRIEALRLAEIFRAKVVDTSIEHFVFEVTGKPSKIETFIQLMIGTRARRSFAHRDRRHRPRRRDANGSTRQWISDAALPGPARGLAGLAADDGFSRSGSG